MTALSRPRSWMMKPRNAVQNAPVIHVNRMKNSPRLIFSRVVKPFARRMSYINPVAKSEVRNVRQKNSTRRRAAIRRRRSGVMTTHLQGASKDKSTFQSTLHHTKSDNTEGPPACHHLSST